MWGQLQTGAELDVKGPGGIITSAEEESLKTDRDDVTDNRADNFCFCEPKIGGRFMNEI